MDNLQKVLDEALSKAPYEIFAKLVDDKLRAEGLNLPTADKARLFEYLKSKPSEPFHLSKRWRFMKQDSTVIKEGEVATLLDETAEILEKLEHQLPVIVQTMVEEMSTNIYRVLEKTWPAESRHQNRERHIFEKRLRQRWGEGIGRLDMLLTITMEFGANLNERLRKDTNFNSPSLLDVLTRLHARACQVTGEIVCLLSAGYADGAMARWRTLHEIAMVSILLQKHGEELAKRYIEHQVVETYNAACVYEKCSPRLGYEPMSQAELEKICRDYKEAIAKYGIPFKESYGWAAQALSEKKPGLRHIEQAAGIDHLRAHYKMASHNVHANPKGIYFKLGLIRDANILMTGSSNAGLADPGHCTAISLVQTSTALGLIQPNIDALIVLNILLKIEKEVGDALFQANQTLEKNLPTKC